MFNLVWTHDGRINWKKKKLPFEIADTEILTFGFTIMADASGDVEQSLKDTLRFRETWL